MAKDPITRPALLVSAVAFIVGASVLLRVLYQSAMWPAQVGPEWLHLKLVYDALGWFDPWFFQYNLLLAVFAVTIIPFLTLHYVLFMRQEKVRRLERELCYRRGDADGKPLFGNNREVCREKIERMVAREFRLGSFGPSMLALMITVAFGMMLVLLGKPAFTPEQTGVHYERGANMLLLGPFIEAHPRGDADATKQLVVSLVAFQFGFLGAYIYALSALARSYFTLDLTPHSLVAATIRMVTASTIACILGFFLATTVDTRVGPFAMRLIPVLSFFLGYFPRRALMVLEQTGRAYFKQKESYESLPMHSLPGMTFANELRLDYEGFDSVEHLEHSDPLDLAVRTGFNYRQLETWREQAWLGARMREDYARWMQTTAILGRDELRHYFTRHGDIDKAVAELSTAASVPPAKVRALYLALIDPKPVVMPAIEETPAPAATTVEGTPNLVTAAPAADV